MLNNKLPHAQHTPAPWSEKPYGTRKQWASVSGADGHAVADCNLSSRTDTEAFANAAYIVKAVNCHKELLEVLYKVRNEYPGVSQETHDALDVAIAKAEAE